MCVEIKPAGKVMGIEPTSYIPVKRYLMEIAFDGGNYSGWQIQPHCLAVQQVCLGCVGLAEFK